MNINLDDEKSSRICADQEIKYFKQKKCNVDKYKALENENEKLINENLKIKEINCKISQQCNELMRKNISLKNNLKKRNLIFNQQRSIFNHLENSIRKLKVKISNYCETKEKNTELIKEIKLLFKQNETFKNVLQVYEQSSQQMQKEEIEFKCVIEKLKKTVSLQNNKIINFNENNSILNSKNIMLVDNINNLQTNITNCLKLLDEMLSIYVTKQNNKVESYELMSNLEIFLNDTFKIFEPTVMELIKLSHKVSEINLKKKIINKKENINLLKVNIKNYLLTIIKNEILNLDFLNVKTIKKDLTVKKSQNYLNSNEIKKNFDIENVILKVDRLKKEINNKNCILKKIKTKISKYGLKIAEKDAIYIGLTSKVQQFKNKIDDSSTLLTKVDKIHKFRRINANQEHILQKLRALVIKQKQKIFDLKKSLVNQIKKHYLEKNKFVNKIALLVKQDKHIKVLQQQFDIKCNEYNTICNEINKLVYTLKIRENKMLEETRLCNVLKSLKEVEKILHLKIEDFTQKNIFIYILKADPVLCIRELSNNLKLTKNKIKYMESESNKLEKQKIIIHSLESISCDFQIEFCQMSRNEIELLLNEKENNLNKYQDYLKQEKILNSKLIKKYDDLHIQYEADKTNYQLQHSQFIDKIQSLQIELKTAKSFVSKYMEKNQSLVDEFEEYKLKAISVFQKYKQDLVSNIKVTELNEQLQEVTKALKQSTNNLENALSQLSIKNSEINMLQDELNKYEKKLSNLTTTLLTKEKENYWLCVEINNIKSTWIKEKITLNDTIVSDKSIHLEEVNRLKQEIILAREANTVSPELRVETPLIENKLQELSLICYNDETFSDFASSDESVKKIAKELIGELNPNQKVLKQLTALLNETEKNDFQYESREDIKRLRSDVNRNAEIKNIEYIKNIIIKFVTLPCGMEKYHLVPVINKLLKLSPEEQKQIETVAKGALSDQNSIWSGLLTWTHRI